MYFFKLSLSDTELFFIVKVILNEVIYVANNHVGS